MMSDLVQRLAALSPEKRALLEAQLKRKGQTYNTFPLSFAQQRLWLVDQLQPGNTSYSLLLAFRLRGALDVPALERSVSTIIERHEVLRTVYPTVRGQPVQAVTPALAVTLPLIELPPEGDRTQAVQAMIEQEGQHVFDLEHGPLIRFLLVRVQPDDHVLITNMHHICSDGWSLAVLTREIAEIYPAYVRGQPSPMAPLPIQYADYAVWQRDSARDAEQARHLAYWRERLLDAPPLLELPTDFARPTVPTARGEVQEARIPLALAERLQALGQTEHATLFMVLLATFQLQLSRLTDQHDVVVGTAVANRNRAETENLIGFFVNTLAMRADLSGNPTFRALLTQVRDEALGAYTHQDVSFDRLLEELHPTRDLSHTPIFQVLLNMINTPTMQTQWGDLAVEIVAPQEGGAKFDLTLYAQEDAEGISLNVVASADLFTGARVQEFLRQFIYLAEQVVSQPDSPIETFSLVTPAAQVVLPDPRAPLSDRWEGAIHTVIAQQAERAPTHLALVDPTEQWSYGELDQRANQLAHWLVAAGIGSGEVVAIYAHRSAALVWAMLGVLKAGAAYLMLDPAYPEARLLEYMTQARPRAIVAVAPAGPLPPDVHAYFAAEHAGHVITLPALAAADQHPLASLPTTPLAVTVGPDDIATISFTSGSTGRPKGILQRHGSLTHFLAWQRETFDLVEQDRHTLLSGLAHDPLQRDIFTPLTIGATIFIPDPEQMGTPGYLATWLRDQAITVTNLTPAMIQLVTQMPPRAAAFHLPALRRAITVGEALKRHDVLRLWDLAPNVV
ncbi:MAG: AMP-binding protein, partial [Ktedonobacterales bacterium]|nr:AMP-binding protein [Ktedonobacterales bacterium]